jgi:YYY domain-containing protein
MLSFLIWYLIIIITGWITFPIAFKFFKRLPDRGYSFSKVLGLLLWGYGFWLLASLHLLQNTISAMLVVLCLVFVISGFVNRKEGFHPIIDWVKSHWKTILSSELVFLIAFGFWAYIRALNPEIIGTEKPMELAFINSILRSTTFPPADPWLSGYSISYYYFGYVMVAMLVKLSGVASGVGFNLAIALWFGLTAVSAYGLLFNLIAFWQKKENERKGIEEERSEKQPYLSSLLGPFFILIVSNLEGFLEMLHSRGLFWKQAADGSFQSKFWTWLNILEINEAPKQALSWIPQRAGGIWWWRASRVVQDWDLLNNRQEVIDEFPFFSYLLADLHPHVLAMPFVILAIAVAFNLWLHIQDGWNGQNNMPFFAWIKKWLSGEQIALKDCRLIARFKDGQFILPVIVLGGLAFLNTWDLPIYVALVAAVWVLADYQQNGWRPGLILDFIGLVIVYVILAVVFYLPFYLGFGSQAGGLLPSMSFYTRGVHFWIMFAPLLIPVFIFAVWQIVAWKKPGKLTGGIKFAAYTTFGLWIFSFLFGWLASELSGWGSSILANSQVSGMVHAIGSKMVEIGGLFANLQGTSDSGVLVLNSLLRRFAAPGTWLTLFILIVLVWAGLGIYRKQISEKENQIAPQQSNSIHAFVLLLILVGAGLTLMPEFVYLRDQFGTRMNTIFKFYFETWILWSLAAAYAVVVLSRSLPRIAYRVFAVGISLVLVLSMAYPFWGLWSKTNHFNMEEMTLDGNAYIQKYNPSEWAAMEWLKNAPEGVIAEAIGGSYTSYARFATQSGLPNVLGWPGHEGQWRGGWYDILSARENDIESLYKTTDWTEAEAIIQRYQIHYIVVSSLENSTYHANTVKFDNFLKIAFQNSAVTIYEVPEISEAGIQ